MTKKEQLNDSLTKLMAMQDLSASALSELTNVVGLIKDVDEESNKTINEQATKIVELSKAYTDLAIHGKVATSEQPHIEEETKGKTLEEIAQEIKNNRK